MLDYTGNGAYCYANSLHMCLRSANAGFGLGPDMLESLTLMPFGCLLLEKPDAQVFLASAPWNDPDAGVSLALRHLGWGCEDVRSRNGEDAEAKLRVALRTGPALLGPLDMNALTYYPGRVSGTVTDHYVVALSALEERFLIHDPHGFPAVEIAADELMAAWGMRLEYGTPYTMRCAFHDQDGLDRQSILARGLASLQEKVSRDEARPGFLGSAAALRQTAVLLREGPSQSLIGSLVHFSLRNGARRCLDGARFLREVGAHDAADAMEEKARIYGRVQYQMAKESWQEAADSFDLLAGAEERFLSAVEKLPAAPERI